MNVWFLSIAYKLFGGGLNFTVDHERYIKTNFVKLLTISKTYFE